MREEASKVGRASKKRQGEARANDVKNKGKERGRRRLPRENAKSKNKRVVKERTRKRELAEVRQKKRLTGGSERKREREKEGSCCREEVGRNLEE